MLSLSKAAAQLGYSESGLRKIVDRTREGKRGRTIRYFQAGKGASIKFRPEWLQEFVEGGTVEPVAPSKRRRIEPQFGFDPALLDL